MPKPIIAAQGEPLGLQLDAGVSYRSIPGFPDYAVGDDGSVWSKKIRGATYKRGPWVKLKQNAEKPTKPGSLPYMRCNLSLRKSYYYRTHLVVLTVFRGPCPSGMLARHLNGKCQDNRLANLVWGTPLENAGDSLLHGTAPRGERCGKAKLTNADVLDILSRKGTLTGTALAKEKGVSHATIYNIWSGARWGHLQG